MTIEEFRDFANCLKNNYTIDFDKLPEFCDMALSLTQWIPVTKGLPKENTHVIVSVMDEGKPFVTTDDYFCHGFDDWKDDVVAWMKTPEPYKGGDS